MHFGTSIPTSFNILVKQQSSENVSILCDIYKIIAKTKAYNWKTRCFQIIIYVRGLSVKFLVGVFRHVQVSTIHALNNYLCTTTHQYKSAHSVFLNTKVQVKVVRA